MKRTRRTTGGLSLIAALAFFLALVLGNIGLHYFAEFSNRSHLLNADALYLPTLFKDILADGGHIREWFLTPAPYFFPDYPVYLVAYGIGDTPFSQILAFALIQTVLALGAMVLVARAAVRVHALLAASTILAVLVWLALSVGEPFNFIFNSAFHYGAFVAAACAVALWIRFTCEMNDRINSGLLVTLAVVSFATTLSDNLFIVQFVAPLLATQIFFAIATRDFSFRREGAAVLVAACGVLGALSYPWLVEKQTRIAAEIGTGKLVSNITDLYGLVATAVANQPILGIILAAYFCIVFQAIFRAFRGGKERAPFHWIAVFSLASMGATAGALALTTNIPMAGRYLIAALSWPVIVVVLFLANVLRERFLPLALGITALALVAMGWSSSQWIRQNGLKKYYPQEISCIDAALENEGLRHGIAAYWDAKTLQNLSRLDLQVAQYFEDLGEMRWITSERYFRSTYDFAIIPKRAEPPYRIPLDALTRLNGAPRRVVTCEHSQVVIYGKDQMRVR